jgi:hypothetical protein
VIAPQQPRAAQPDQQHRAENRLREVGDRIKIIRAEVDSLLADREAFRVMIRRMQEVAI